MNSFINRQNCLPKQIEMSMTLCLVFGCVTTVRVLPGPTLTYVPLETPPRTVVGLTSHEKPS